ncbi:MULTISPECIES: PP2C family protein-serine/threonine phosphatase [Microbacterium]|uniref:Serine/threonine-protein phosphatase n=1 Tax=Microbacterium wangchenii TaxID=2541726 RepID=A0ABX5SQQ4_9MICO|nr:MULTISPECIES: protein phosphatase 2C domain-containing protein [Microbacterium]MCK6065008.1 protein phosphatase 2C domain-containing protein [Microbacterium sp. EYE_512]QBR88481.1 serine/threonine-protein phosphatase [Microbacterium wangchenii]TFV82466.1 serine/threonine-protein phosphatase [Microbacterium sp. dk485]TXK20208.1 serine/threonine-protein phosphatase [Microbacterium wangchenii]
MPIRLSAAAVSDIGSHRATNQDAAFTASWGAAVADGVGGGPSGDLASAALVHRLVAGPVGASDAEALLVRIREANWDLRAHVLRDPSLQGMSTTFTGLFVGAGGSLLVAHTGDSRGYLLRDGWFTRETRDDSYVQALVDSGLLAPEAAATHPRRNIITASLGGGEEDVVSVSERQPVVGDRWLLCSDGVTDYAPETEVAALLAAGRSPRDTAAEIVAYALQAGSADNVTAVVCDVVDDSADATGPVFFGSAAGYFTEDVETG